MNPSTQKAAKPTQLKSNQALSSKFGVVTVENGEFHPGEIVFVLRSSDAHAVGLLQNYRNRHAGIEDPKKAPGPDEIRALDELVGQYAEWAVANPTLVKIPTVL